MRVLDSANIFFVEKWIVQFAGVMNVLANFFAYDRPIDCMYSSPQKGVKAPINIFAKKQRIKSESAKSVDIGNLWNLLIVQDLRWFTFEEIEKGSFQV